MCSHRHWGNWRSDALDPDGQCRTVWAQSRTSCRQRVGSPDSLKRCERGLRLGPGVQTEIRDPVVLETCEGPGYREAERSQTIKSLQNRWDPTLVKTVRDFQRVSAQG